MNDFSNAKDISEHEPEATEPRADTNPDPARDGFRATWARTTNNARIGKVKTPSGRWPPTPGAKSTRYIFEVRVYASIVEFCVDYEAKLKSGCWTLIAGELRPDLDPNQPHQRVGTNFIDVASTKLTFDFDGLEPDKADTPIDGADAYAGNAVFIAMDRMPEAFRRAAWMVSATSSTGLKINSNGEPSEGKARFRATLEMTRALPCKQKGIVTEAIKSLPGLGGVKNDLCSIAGFEFIDRPVFLKGEVDPITKPVYLLEGGLLDIDAACAELGIDLDAAESATTNGARKKRSAGSGAPSPAPPAVAYAMADSVVNGPWFDDRGHWIGYAHTMRNVFGYDLGRAKFEEFNDRRIGADGKPVANDPDEDKRAFDTLPDSQNDIWDLAGYAREQGGEAGRAAYYGFVFPDLTPEEEALLDGITAGAPEKAADAHRGGAWDEWRAALERLRAARPAPVFGANGWLPHPSIGGVLIFNSKDISPVPLRPNMTDRHARGEVSMLVGSAGGGKSTMSTNYAVAVAFEDPAVIGQSAIDWCGDVVIVSNEENEQTVRRRIRALLNRSGLSPDSQKHRIVIWPETLVLGHAVGSDGIAPTRAAVTFVDTLAQLNAESEIALVVFDTLASMFSGLNENSAQMDKAVGMIADIGKAGFLTPDIIHHSSKAQDGREAVNSFRGSSAIGAKVREHSTIASVPMNEWPVFGWSADEGARTVRIMGQKANDKPIAGVWGFRWEFPRVGAYDVRNPSDPKSASIGILAPLGDLKPKQDLTQKALQALYDAYQAGAQITRGGGGGPIATHHGHRFLMDAGLGDRKAVEALILELIQKGLVTTKPGRLGTNAATFLIPSQPV